ncbi:MAG: GTP 3',8-cyclase MoaA [Candidatus Omnitrophica bacterium]|nr:GTP 3',8-cyclase MoaA [Candidatus Omnitrophota bacterium]MDE2009851.1 GTP 3',8-cyclase MoaA [Candidatus Omnitrophota bacterium]MDE2214367.1 GTP 3',8-cyclase MoaA [Candidatus Omnitrophota bacterium]MDE2231116.1 GTP 3',8-cyclase MoaA [Candidatus Omnitrophota bacterium]
MSGQISPTVEKTIVLDKANRLLQDLRVSVIDRCNLRCPYCMPRESFGHAYKFLNPNEWLTFEEIETLVRTCVDLGVRKVRLTGGEPLLRPNLPDLIYSLKKIEGIEDLALTTNGILLAGLAGRLRESGLDRLTISLDSFDEDVFKKMSGGRGDLRDVLRAIDCAQKAGFFPLKINCVVQRGKNDHTILDMVKHFRNTGHILRFIEYMDVGNQNQWNFRYVVGSDEIISRIHKQYPLRLLERNYSSETSERYGFVDGSGEIGFVSSVTKAFCGFCTRLRLSADGKFYTCLFANQGLDMRPILRNRISSRSVKETIHKMWMVRNDHYSETRLRDSVGQIKTKKVEMFQIGG